MDHQKTESYVVNGTSQLPDIPPPDKAKTKLFAFHCAIVASLASILVGYDIGVMNGAVIFIQEDLKLSDVQLEVLDGILNLFSMFDSVAAGKTSDWIGRRYTIVLAAAAFFVGAILTGTAMSYALLMVGRLVTGIGVGYALMVSPVYTAEVSPASRRGFLTSFPEIFMNFGILLGYVSNWAFSKLTLQASWRLMLGIGAVPSVFMGLAVLAMPESPRWLVLKGRLTDAKGVLVKTYTKQEAQSQLIAIQAAAGIPLECTDKVVEVPKPKKGYEAWKELLVHPTPAVQRVLILAVGIHFFQQASGIDAVVHYSPRIFREARIMTNSSLLSARVTVGCVKTLSILVATFFLDRIGRRPLLLSSVGGMIASLSLLSFGLTMVYQNPDKKMTWALTLCIAMVLFHVVFFSIGLGPITWFYSAEIFPLRLRAQGNSIGVAVNRVVRGTLSITFLSMSSATTVGGGFFLFAGVRTIGWVFFYILLPETQGRNLEDMDALFGTSRRKRSQDRDETCNSQVQLGTM